jgi:glycosyltransferase involved in cell wall biosynthesis
VGLCNAMDEVWVPSRFNVATFSDSGVEPGKLVSIPYGIDTADFTPSGIEREPPFTFLYVCSFGWRKGLDLLLESFLEEFDRGEARLVMRVHSEGYQGVAAEEVEQVLYEAVQGHLRKPPERRPEVTILTEALSATDLKRLYESADLYISTDRANGWGVPCQEAMALGVPAATIDWSGSTQFMHNDNSVLIRPEDDLVPVDPRLAEALPGLYAGHRWARVEPAEVRRAMRWAFENPERLAAIAVAGREHVRKELGIEEVARRVADRLSVIEPSAQARVLGAARLYQAWISAIRLRERLRRARLRLARG